MIQQRANPGEEQNVIAEMELGGSIDSSDNRSPQPLPEEDENSQESSSQNQTSVDKTMQEKLEKLQQFRLALELCYTPSNLACVILASQWLCVAQRFQFASLALAMADANENKKEHEKSDKASIAVHFQNECELFYYLYFILIPFTFTVLNFLYIRLEFRQRRGERVRHLFCTFLPHVLLAVLYSGLQVAYWQLRKQGGNGALDFLLNNAVQTLIEFMFAAHGFLAYLGNFIAFVFIYFYLRHRGCLDLVRVLSFYVITTLCAHSVQVAALYVAQD